MIYSPHDSTRRMVYASQSSMRTLLRCRALLAALAVISCFVNRARADLWVTGYFPGYEQSSLPASNIDFSVVTHVIHFSLIPNFNGTLDTTGNGITPSFSSDLVTQAHAAGRKAIICVGGANSESGFQGATAAGNRSAFIHGLTNFMATFGYDGVDIDWEPLPALDFLLFTNFVNGLRTALDDFPQHKMLTVAAAAYSYYTNPPPSEYILFASLQTKFDQINVMTYDLSGPYAGWVTWFNSPIYDGGYRFPSTGGLVPSIDGAISGFVSNGVAPAKLAIGTPFYVDIWTHGAGTSTGGTTQPRQTWTNAPTILRPQPTYADLVMRTVPYFYPNQYHWDTSAQAAYASVTNTPATNDEFISFDDQRACQSKVSYARNHGLGGIMIWELGQDLPSFGFYAANSLVFSIKQALATPGATAIQFLNTNVSLSFTSSPLGLYRVQWSSNLAAGLWNTLTNNVASTGGVTQITDPTPPTTQLQRFYRVKTPP
jgi:chitinase